MDAVASPSKRRKIDEDEDEDERDVLTQYMSVHEALARITKRGRVLGTVVNGVTVEEDGADYEEGERERVERGAVDAAHKGWAVQLGQAMYAMHENTAFVCGGSVRLATASAEPGYAYIYGIEQYVHDHRMAHTLTVWSKDTKEVEYKVKSREEDSAGADGGTDKDTDKGTDKGTGDLTIPLDGVLTPEQLEVLLPRCTPAAFGDLRTQTTVHDATVRAAVELAADSWDISATETGKAYGKPFCNVPLADTAPPFLTIIHRQVHDHLLGRDVEFVPYKLNVYGAGGFFKPHVDTPLGDSARMLGTLVVALPSPFEGGALTVWPPSGTAAPSETAAPGEGATPSASAGAGEVVANTNTGRGKGKYVFDWAPASATPGVAQWAAFYGNCVHEVAPVTAGQRVTLTYLMLAADSAPPEVAKVEDQVSCAYARAATESGTVAAKADAVVGLHVESVLALLRAPPPSLVAKTGAVGLILAHKYTFTAVAKGILKGGDAQLRDALVAAGFAVALQPAILRTYHLRGEGWDAVADNTVYSFSAADLAALRHGTRAPGAAVPDDIPFVRVAAEAYGHEAEHSGTLVLDESLPGAEFTGNESRPYEDTTLYFAAVLVVTLDADAEAKVRAAKAAKAAKAKKAKEEEEEKEDSAEEATAT